MSLSVSRHIGSRVVAALRPDPRAYEEVESDVRATAAWLLSFTFLVVMGLLFATPVF